MEAVVFVFSLLDCCALIFLSVYFIITLSDLECDYINARSCCSKLNKWVIPELIGHTVITVLMLVSLHWFIFLLNLPAATWNIYRFIMVPSGNMGVFDPTEIHNRGQLKSHMKEAMIKLGFHLLCFFMYLYRLCIGDAELRGILRSSYGCVHFVRVTASACRMTSRSCSVASLLPGSGRPCAPHQHDFSLDKRLKLRSRGPSPPAPRSAAQEPEAPEIILRTVTIAVYFFLFEQKEKYFCCIFTI
uniref:Cornichon family AMPA receptor auxiliary protein 4 n=1 Tax=Canis lupus familiaris TaxID=9615 RepID=A0A8P0PQL2_CANLF